jgi:TPR repeat protein
VNRAITIALVLCVAPVAQAGSACSDAYAGAADPATPEQCRRLAESGDPDSEFGYGLLLWSGHGRTSQPKEAVLWLRRAAKHGHLLARVALGRFLTDPEAPPEVRNLSEGYAWWVVAGETDAASSLKRRLTPSQLAAGEQLAKQFAGEHGLSR